jgi:ADP-ribose pyrophosphatase YjhB (NUDIX family)
MSDNNSERSSELSHKSKILEGGKTQSVALSCSSFSYDKKVDTSPREGKTKKKTFNPNKNIICCNCGKNGHIYKKCFNPITSLGIICVKSDELKSVENLISKSDWKRTGFNDPNIYSKSSSFSTNTSSQFQYLLIRRKDSLSFAEFVRVKYNISDVEYIKKMLKNMSKDEHAFLQDATSPDEIWNRLWTSKKKSRTRINEYNRVKKKLGLLLNGAKDKYDNLFTIKSLLSDITTVRICPEWGFPKGRRVPKESDIQCAIREFCEETDIHRYDIHLLKKIGPVEEIFTGSNNVIYKHIYYIAELKNNINVSVNPNNIHQKAEIGDIKWFNKKETIKKLEAKNKERIAIFTRVSDYLENLENLPSLD